MGGRRTALHRPPRAGRPDVVQRQKLLRVRGRSVAWVPPLLLLAAIAVLDWNTSGEFRVISWIVLVPGIAAAICGVWLGLLGAAGLLGLTEFLGLLRLPGHRRGHQLRP